MRWLVAVSGLAVAMGCLVAMACLPWRLQLRWRKTWAGPLAVRARIHSPWQWWSLTCNRRSRVLQALQNWVWPLHSRSPAHLLRQGKRKLYVLAEISPAFSLMGWTIQMQLGFDDPSVTGECLGLLAAMPLPIQRSISITFEQVGCRTCGRLDVTVRPSLLLVCLITVWTRQTISWLRLQRLRY